MTDRRINKTAYRSAVYFYLFYSSLFTFFTFLYLSLTFILTTVAARWQLCSPVPVCNRGCSRPLPPLPYQAHCIALHPPLDLVETTSPGLTSPSLAYSYLIETTSLGRPQRCQMYDNCCTYNCYPHTTYDPVLYDLRHFDLFGKFVRLFSPYVRQFR